MLARTGALRYPIDSIEETPFMRHVRPAAMAGLFYPADAQSLFNDISTLLDPAVAQLAPKAPAPKALIVPHAGYVYSGAIAALAYATVLALRGRITRVVLLGPVHRVPVRGLALPGVQAFATPLGEVSLDTAAMAAVAHLPQVCTSPEAHAQEHSLEVQLPFLQMVLGIQAPFQVVPLAVGDASAEEVAQVLAMLWGGPETLVLISSDLSHFLPYDQAQASDTQTLQQVLALQGPLHHQQACGASPINGLLLLARHLGLKPQLLGFCNSGDTAGERERVVGYASVGFFAPTSPDAPSESAKGQALLAAARASIDSAFGRSSPPTHEMPGWQEPGACFVTLTREGQLRGCMGSLEAHRPWLHDVQATAQAAAFHDPRFVPLSLDEWANTRVEVSLLSPLQAMAFADEAHALAQLRPGVDGVLLSYGAHRSTYLPQVWEQLPSPELFMAQLKQKAGLPPDFWSPDLQLFRYTVSKWKESDTPTH